MKKMTITWYGTASISIETEKTRILIDPFLAFPGSETRNSIRDFSGYDTILLTHGHLDHLMSVPKIMMENEEAAVFCTETPAKILEKKGVPGEYVMQIRPGCRMKFGDIQVTVLKGKHIQFDKKLEWHTLASPRMLLYACNIPRLLIQNLICQENGETVSYFLEIGDRSILVLGSLGLSEEENYPKAPDLLVLPYQGASDLVHPALEVIGRIRPGAVLLDHFDNTFPPVSRTVDTRELKKALDEKYPDLPVVKPKPGKGIQIGFSK